MILYKALKYKIFEYCLNNFLTTLFNNMKPPENTLHNIKVGDKFKEIIFINAANKKMHFYDCIVKDRQSSTNLFLITFSFERTSNFKTSLRQASIAQHKKLMKNLTFIKY